MRSPLRHKTCQRSLSRRAWTPYFSRYSYHFAQGATPDPVPKGSEPQRHWKHADKRNDDRAHRNRVSMSVRRSFCDDERTELARLRQPPKGSAAGSRYGEPLTRSMSGSIPTSARSAYRVFCGHARRWRARSLALSSFCSPTFGTGGNDGPGAVSLPFPLTEAARSEKFLTKSARPDDARSPFRRPRMAPDLTFMGRPSSPQAST